MISCLALEMSRTTSSPSPSKISSSMRSSLLPILPSIGNDGVDAVIDDLVEQVARALGEQGSRAAPRWPAALEQVVDRLQRLVGQRDQEVGADEHVDLGRVQPRDDLVVAREVQHDEQVVVVLVDLRALVARADVLVVEGMEVEVLLQPRLLERARALDVDPAQAGRLDDLDARLGALRRASAAASGRADRTGSGAGSA